MKVSYKFFKEYPITRMLITRMMNGSFPEIKTSYRVKKLVEDLSKEFEIYKALLKEKEELNVWDDDKKVVDNEEVQRGFEQLYSHEFEVDHTPLTSGEILHIKNLTPMELDLLAMISEPNALASLQE